MPGSVSPRHLGGRVAGDQLISSPRCNLMAEMAHEVAGALLDILDV